MDRLVFLWRPARFWLPIFSVKGSRCLGAPHLPGFGRCGCLLITNNLANDFLLSPHGRSAANIWPRSRADSAIFVVFCHMLKYMKTKQLLIGFLQSEAKDLCIG